MKKDYPTYEEAKMIVNKAGIKGQKEYRLYYKELKLPSNPNVTYKNKWVNWSEFFGKDTYSFPSYQEAKRIVGEAGIKSCKVYQKSYRKLKLPSLPEKYYRGKGWTNWNVFLGKEKFIFPSYQEAKRIVEKNGIKSQSEYLAVYKKLRLPSGPSKYYCGKGWVNWNVFLGKKKVIFPSYEEAKRIVEKNGIKSQSEYLAVYKELDLPSNPHLNYKDKGWVNWGVFLGKDTYEYPLYEEAQRIVIEKGIKSQGDYRSYYKGLRLPAAPNMYYKNKGWTSWFDFLGKTKRIASKERKTRVLSKLYINPSLLEDDAPAKIIYMLASEVDRNLAMKMEELLGTTSYEDRLNWVKNQLKSLKIDTTHMLPTSTDRLSALESTMEVFEDVFDTLPEEKIERIDKILDNYLHSAVNRELIKNKDE